MIAYRIGFFARSYHQWRPAAWPWRAKWQALGWSAIIEMLGPAG